ncbi:MAG: virulence factor SrfB [Alphaproteobacteria bacterium]|nr:virulence factor SrfB [Alphaproteobacteria bacterium]
MIKKAFVWQKRTVVTLVPNSGIQFFDLDVSERLANSVSQRFHCEIRPDELDADGRPTEVLHPAGIDEDGEPWCEVDGRRIGLSPDDVFMVRADQAFEKIAGRWLPVPVLRIGEDGGFAEGPTNWARLFVSKVTPADDQETIWRITLALDTLLVDRPADHRYAAPEPRDAAEGAPFGLATGLADVNFFVRQEWVRNWLRDSFLERESEQRRRKVTLDQLRHPSMYWATYLVALKVLGAAEDQTRPVDAPDAPVVPRMRLLDTKPYVRDRRPIPVNLVIDIGNSRTCGILIEEPADGATRQRVDMSQAYRLELRDLSNPAHCYADPFESRVEFCTTSFNRGAWSRMAGRPFRDAFWWPSPVRTGPEAAWLASLTDGTQGRSGLSSPKRYLWDGSERLTPWVNNGGLVKTADRLPPIKGPIVSRLSQNGRPLRQGELPAMKPMYSRSSLYMLMLTELLMHALTQINGPGTRAMRPDSDEPRHLRRIILTVPSATPVAELKALKRLAKWSIDLLWQVMSWDANHPLFKRPEVCLDWDEATATHLVYLYSEITQKLQTAPRDFFELVRRNRQAPRDRPMLRVASMDMGGGTTDLMIIQHEISDGDRTIIPQQLFREGFRLAGDDILKQVIEDEVLPCLGAAVSASGARRADAILGRLFGGDHEGMPQQQRTLRALFVSQVLRPAALALLAGYESHRSPAETLSVRLMGALPKDRLPKDAVLDYVRDTVRREGGEGFSLENVTIETTARRVGATIRSVVEAMLTDLCDLVRAYDCDILLLSGRPSRFPAVKDLIFGRAPVPPGRIVPMDAYEVGSWYPFQSHGHRLDDPKTTAAVGAMLCHLCEGHVEGMLVRTSEIRMRSTARFIGVMELNDQIKSEKLVFSGINLDRHERSPSRSVALTPPAFIGYRQLPLDRWKTTPLYYIDFVNRRQVSQLRMPLAVTLERNDPVDDDDEGALEEFSIRQAVDADNQDATDALRLSFQTLRVERDAEGGYWLDSGVLSINWRS